MTPVQENLLAILRRVKDVVTADGYAVHSGLCEHIEDEAYNNLRYPSEYAVADMGIEHAQAMMQLWPEYSGDPSFPVPDTSDPWPSRNAASKLYLNTFGRAFWNPEHHYGAARLRLLAWMIDHLEQA